MSHLDKHSPPPPKKYTVSFRMHPVIFTKIVKVQPIPGGRVIFIHGSSSSQAAVVSLLTVQKAMVESKSAQVNELIPLILDLQRSPEEAHRTPFCGQNSCELPRVLLRSPRFIFIRHMRACTELPGSLSKGNELADSCMHTVLAMPTFVKAQ